MIFPFMDTDRLVPGRFSGRLLLPVSKDRAPFIPRIEALFIPSSYHNAINAYGSFLIRTLARM